MNTNYITVTEHLSDLVTWALLIVCPVAWAVFFRAWVSSWMVKNRRKEKLAEDIMLIRVVRDILDQSGWHHRRSWTNGQQREELLYLVPSSEDEGRYYPLWLYVRASSSHMEVAIEYDGRFPSDHFIRLAGRLAEHLNGNDRVQAKVASRPSSQPDFSRISRFVVGASAITTAS